MSLFAFVVVWLGCAAQQVPNRADEPTGPVSYDRKALIVGVSEYETGDFARLESPERDAKAMAARMHSFDIEPHISLNPTRSRLEKEINQFILDTENTPESIFYFSGHGLQFNGETWLFSKDSRRPEEPSTAHLEGFSVQRLIDRMACQGDFVTRIIIIDACSFEPDWRPKDIAQERGPGWEKCSNPSQRSKVYLVLASRPGTRAEDGLKGENSRFTAALLKYMGDASLHLEEIIWRAKRDVAGSQMVYPQGAILPFYFSKSPIRYLGMKKEDAISEFTKVFGANIQQTIDGSKEYLLSPSEDSRSILRQEQLVIDSRTRRVTNVNQIFFRSRLFVQEIEERNGTQCERNISATGCYYMKETSKSKFMEYRGGRYVSRFYIDGDEVVSASYDIAP